MKYLMKCSKGELARRFLHWGLGITGAMLLLWLPAPVRQVLTAGDIGGAAYSRIIQWTIANQANFYVYQNAEATMRLVDHLYQESRFQESADLYLSQIRQAQTLAPLADGQGVVASTLQDGDRLPLIVIVLFGTGIRNRSAQSAVNVNIGGVVSPVLYASVAPGFVGLDQVNAIISRSLAGRGEIDLVLTEDGKTANAVRVNIK